MSYIRITLLYYNLIIILYNATYLLSSSLSLIYLLTYLLNMKTLYIANAFSLSMLMSEYAMLTIENESKPDVYFNFDQYDTIVSCVGHEDTAKLFSQLLGRDVQMARINVQLKLHDSMLVGQLVGGRLPEGSTTLPEGVTIVWKLVRVTYSLDD